MADLDRKLEIYKVFVTTITANENRRQQTSTVYLGMVAAVVTAAGVVRDIPLIYPALVILSISVIWFFTIGYFRRLAKAKFEVVSKIEEDLPIAVFDMEWQILSTGKNNRIGLTHLEMFVPSLIAASCSVYIVFWIVSHCYR